MSPQRKQGIHTSFRRLVRPLLAQRAHFVLLLIGLAAGCGRDTGPLLVHGKPVSHWLDELKKPDVKARTKAVHALGLAGKADEAAIPGIISALKDQDASVRDTAVLCLLNLGKDAKDALSALEAMKEDTHANVRKHVALALERIQGE
jgi:hypothetical protein